MTVSIDAAALGWGTYTELPQVSHDKTDSSSMQDWNSPKVLSQAKEDVEILQELFEEAKHLRGLAPGETVAEWNKAHSSYVKQFEQAMKSLEGFLKNMQDSPYKKYFSDILKGLEAQGADTLLEWTIKWKDGSAKETELKLRELTVALDRNNFAGGNWNKYSTVKQAMNDIKVLEGIFQEMRQYAFSGKKIPQDLLMEFTAALNDLHFLTQAYIAVPGMPRKFREFFDQILQPMWGNSYIDTLNAWVKDWKDGGADLQDAQNMFSRLNEAMNLFLEYKEGKRPKRPKNIAPTPIVVQPIEPLPVNSFDTKKLANYLLIILMVSQYNVSVNVESMVQISDFAQAISTVREGVLKDFEARFTIEQQLIQGIGNLSQAQYRSILSKYLSAFQETQQSANTWNQTLGAVSSAATNTIQDDNTKMNQFIQGMEAAENVMRSLAGLLSATL